MKTVNEIKAALQKEFNDGSFRSNLKIEMRPYRSDKEDGMRLEITDMYERPLMRKFNGKILKFFEAIRECTGYDNLDINQEVAENGCESCDYGSKYGWVFFVWNDRVNDGRV